VSLGIGPDLEQAAFFSLGNPQGETQWRVKLLIISAAGGMNEGLSGQYIMASTVTSVCTMESIRLKHSFFCKVTR